MISLEDKKFLARCNYIARLGQSNVAPNPAVGCVIVHDSIIIGESLHKYIGEAHAEVNAINSIRACNKDKLKASTVYVSLEPCSHFNRTPPCALTLVKSKVKRVVIATMDPHLKVNGKGIDILKKDNIEVLLSSTGNPYDEEIKKFYYNVKYSLPYVLIKFAQTSDGYIGKEGNQVKISNLITKRYVHKLRAEYQAIMVGTNTLLNDNPALNNRLAYGPSPIVIVIDRHGRLTGTEQVFRANEKIYYCTSSKISLDTNGDNIILLQFLEDEWSLKGILSKLFETGIQSIMVEGGAKLISSFIAEDIWCELIQITSNKLLGGGIMAPRIKNATLIDEDRLEEDNFKYFRHQKLNKI